MTTNKPFRTLLATLLTIIFCDVGAAHAQTAPEEIVFSLSPAVTDDHPAERVSVRTEIAPGHQYQDAVTLHNFTDEPVTFQVSASDGITSASGAFDVLAPDTESQGAGTWFELEHQTITVEAESHETIGFTVTVPDNATPGDHPAGITASLADQDEVFNVVSRVGVRTHIRVSGEIQPGLVFDDIQTSYTPSLNPFAPGTLTTRYTISNQGNVRLGATTTVASSGPFGWNFSVSEPAEIREILPGDTVSFETTVDGVWPLVFGSAYVEASPSVVGDDQFDAQLTAASHEQSVVLLSWVWLAFLAALSVVIVFAVWRRKHRTKKFETAVAQEAQKRAAQLTSTSQV